MEMETANSRRELNIRKNRLHRALDIVITVIIGAAAAAALFLTLYPLRVADDGMSPMLREGDIVVINRLSKYKSKPVRGDAAAFLDTDGSMRLGRIIAFAGETVQVQDGNVYVNGEWLDEYTYIVDFYGEMDMLTVPNDSYFMLCDNRTLAVFDAEHAIVGADDVQGVVCFRIYPVDRMNVFTVD